MADRSRFQPWWSLGLVVLIAGLVFLPAAGFEFVSLDDDINVYDNGYVTAPSLASLLRFWQGPYQNLYIPLTYTLWALQAKISLLVSADSGGGPSPHLFHSVNILLHLLTTGVVFALVRALVKDRLAAACGALLFAIHPVQVEPVAWVTGFKDLLCGWWSVLALWLYLLSVQASGNKGRRLLLYGGATLCYCLALLSKPVAVVLPLAAATIALLLLGQSPRVLGRSLLPWVVISIPVILVTKQAQPDAQQLFNPTLWQRFLVAGDTITFYLTKLLLPLNLAADYGRTPPLVLGQGSIYATGLLPYLLALLLLGKRVRARWLLAPVALFLIPLAPVLGFVTFDLQNMSTVADRYLYLALLGPVLGVSYWFSRHQGKGVIACGLGVFVLLGLASAVQVRTWRDSTTFFQHILQVNPRSWSAYGNLGNVMVDQNRVEEAIAYFKKVLEVQPDSAKAYVNLGNQYRELQRPEEAIAHYRKALEYNPNYDLAYKRLGDMFVSLGRKEEAIWPYRRALLLNPELAEVHLNLIPIYQELKREGEGIAFYREAIELHPDSVPLYGSLGFLLNAANRKEEAISAFQRALTLDPGFVGTYNDLGNIYLDLGDQQSAINAFTQAIAIEPDFALAHANLARVYLAQGQYREAILHADQAQALGLEDPDLLSSVAPYRE